MKKCKRTECVKNFVKNKKKVWIPIVILVVILMWVF